MSGACLAATGHEVICADSDDSKIRKLNAGEVPIYEEHLDKVIEVARRAKKLTFTNSVAEAVRAGDAIFICVGTPPLVDGGADLSAIENVARIIIAAEARTPKLSNPERKYRPGADRPASETRLAGLWARSRRDIPRGVKS